MPFPAIRLFHDMTGGREQVPAGCLGCTFGDASNFGYVVEGVAPCFGCVALADSLLLGCERSFPLAGRRRTALARSDHVTVSAAQFKTEKAGWCRRLAEVNSRACHAAAGPRWLTTGGAS